MKSFNKFLSLLALASIGFVGTSCLAMNNQNNVPSTSNVRFYVKYDAARGVNLDSGEAFYIFSSTTTSTTMTSKTTIEKKKIVDIRFYFKTINYKMSMANNAETYEGRLLTGIKKTDYDSKGNPKAYSWLMPFPTDGNGLGQADDFAYSNLNGNQFFSTKNTETKYKPERVINFFNNNFEYKEVIGGKGYFLIEDQAQNNNNNILNNNNLQNEQLQNSNQMEIIEEDEMGGYLDFNFDDNILNDEQKKNEINNDENMEELGEEEEIDFGIGEEAALRLLEEEMNNVTVVVEDTIKNVKITGKANTKKPLKQTTLDGFLNIKESKKKNKDLMEIDSDSDDNNKTPGSPFSDSINSDNDDKQKSDSSSGKTLLNITVTSGAAVLSFSCPVVALPLMLGSATTYVGGLTVGKVFDLLKIKKDSWLRSAVDLNLEVSRSCFLGASLGFTAKVVNDAVQNFGQVDQQNPVENNKNLNKRPSPKQEVYDNASKVTKNKERMIKKSLGGKQKFNKFSHNKRISIKKYDNQQLVKKLENGCVPKTLNNLNKNFNENIKKFNENIEKFKNKLPRGNGKGNVKFNEFVQKFNNKKIDIINNGVNNINNSTCSVPKHKESLDSFCDLTNEEKLEREIYNNKQNTNQMFENLKKELELLKNKGNLGSGSNQINNQQPQNKFDYRNDCPQEMVKRYENAKNTKGKIASKMIINDACIDDFKSQFPADIEGKVLLKKCCNESIGIEKNN